MSFAKDITISVFLHLIIVTTALLLSVSLTGGSSRFSDYRVISVNIIDENTPIMSFPDPRLRHSRASLFPRSSRRLESRKTDESGVKVGEGIKAEAGTENPDVKKERIESTKTIDLKNKDDMGGVAEAEPVKSLGDENPSPHPSPQWGKGGSKIPSPQWGKGKGVELNHSTGEEEGLINLIKDKIRRYIEDAKAYPPLARKRGIEGVVYIKFRVNPDGQPVDVQITKSSGSRILDSGASRIIEKAAPFPYINSAIEVPISFRLDGE